jgi:hypothetical protein
VWHDSRDFPPFRFLEENWRVSRSGQLQKCNGKGIDALTIILPISPFLKVTLPLLFSYCFSNSFIPKSQTSKVKTYENSSLLHSKWSPITSAPRCCDPANFCGSGLGLCCGEPIHLVSGGQVGRQGSSDRQISTSSRSIPQK